MADEKGFGVPSRKPFDGMFDQSLIGVRPEDSVRPDLVMTPSRFREMIAYDYDNLPTEEKRNITIRDYFNLRLKTLSPEELDKINNTPQYEGERWPYYEPNRTLETLLNRALDNKAPDEGLGAPLVSPIIGGNSFSDAESIQGGDPTKYREDFILKRNGKEKQPTSSNKDKNIDSTTRSSVPDSIYEIVRNGIRDGKNLMQISDMVAMSPDLPGDVGLRDRDRWVRDIIEAVSTGSDVPEIPSAAAGSDTGAPAPVRSVTVPPEPAGLAAPSTTSLESPRDAIGDPPPGTPGTNPNAPRGAPSSTDAIPFAKTSPETRVTARGMGAPGNENTEAIPFVRRDGATTTPGTRVAMPTDGTTAQGRPVDPLTQSMAPWAKNGSPLSKDNSLLHGEYTLANNNEPVGVGKSSQFQPWEEEYIRSRLGLAAPDSTVTNTGAVTDSPAPRGGVPATTGVPESMRIHPSEYAGQADKPFNFSSPDPETLRTTGATIDTAPGRIGRFMGSAADFVDNILRGPVGKAASVYGVGEELRGTPLNSGEDQQLAASQDSDRAAREALGSQYDAYAQLKNDYATAYAALPYFRVDGQDVPLDTPETERMRDDLLRYQERIQGWKESLAPTGTVPPQSGTSVTLPLETTRLAGSGISTVQPASSQPIGESRDIQATSRDPSVIQGTPLAAETARAVSGRQAAATMGQPYSPTPGKAAADILGTPYTERLRLAVADAMTAVTPTPSPTEAGRPSGEFVNPPGGYGPQTRPGAMDRPVGVTPTPVPGRWGMDFGRMGDTISGAASAVGDAVRSLGWRDSNAERDAGITTQPTATQPTAQPTATQPTATQPTAQPASQPPVAQPTAPATGIQPTMPQAQGGIQPTNPGGGQGIQPTPVGNTPTPSRTQPGSSGGGRAAGGSPNPSGAGDSYASTKDTRNMTRDEWTGFLGMMKNKNIEGFNLAGYAFIRDDKMPSGYRVIHDEGRARTPPAGVGLATPQGG